MPKKAIKNPPIVKRAVSIDYPQEEELVRPGHYAVRITAAEAGAVDISLDGKGWHACYPSVGYFWFDWQPTGTGQHELLVRLRTPDGHIKRSSVRSCLVSDGT